MKLRLCKRAHQAKLDHRPTCGNPLDFRGLRHEPVNEEGVVLLFGIVGRELGYLAEAVQEGFPDCEAKRQIGPGKWQRSGLSSSTRAARSATMALRRTDATASSAG